MSAPFTETEKETFSTKFGLEALKITDKYEAIGFNKREALVPEKRTDITSPQIKSRLSQLDGSMPHQNGLFSITSTTVGPQRINLGHHADHPFLAETAFLALTLSSHLESGYMSIQYKTEVFEGDVLESYEFGLDSGSSNSVFLVATRRVTQERKVVLIAFDS